MSEYQIRLHACRPGIDTSFKPVEPEFGAMDIRTMLPNDPREFYRVKEYDVLLRCSSLNPMPWERLAKEHLEQELEKFRIISESVRDTNTFHEDKKVNPTGKNYMVFSDFTNSKKLDEIDKVRTMADKKAHPDNPSREEKERKLGYITWRDSE